jgi:hypothetical protein
MNFYMLFEVEKENAGMSMLGKSLVWHWHYRILASPVAPVMD